MAEIEWPELVPGDCEENARRIWARNGGTIHRIAPAAVEGDAGGRRRVLGRSANNPAGDWFFHDVVRVADRVYDEFTGPEGVPFDEYKEQFDERDQLDFGF